MVRDQSDNEIDQLAANTLALKTRINRQPGQLDGRIVLVTKIIQHRLMFVELLDGDMRAQSRDVGQHLCFALGDKHKRSSQVFLMKLLCFFAQKGLERSKRRIAKAQRIAAIGRRKLTQLEAQRSAVT